MQPGDRVGPYVVESRLGAGQMGVVYAVRHAELGARYALKVLRRELCSARDVLRFQREVEHLAAVSSHPRVVPIHTAGEDRGSVYYVMDLVEGRTLQEHLDRGGAMPPTLAARYVRDVADALTALHRAGVVHRDIKPANVMVDARLDVARLADFGLARSFLDERNRLTMTGELVGTPHFMAPEQALGEPVGAAADVYALGMVLFTLLAGRPAVAGKGLIDVLTRVGSGELERLPALAPDTPDALIALIEACLHRDPATRPEARSVRDALDAFLRAPRAESTASASRRGGALLVLAVGAAAAVGLAGLALASKRPASGGTSGPTPTDTTPRPTPPEPAPPQVETPYEPAWLEPVGGGKLEDLREALRGIDADGAERLSATQRARLARALRRLDEAWRDPFEEQPALGKAEAGERVEQLILVQSLLRRLAPAHRLPEKYEPLLQPFFVLKLGAWVQEVDPRVLRELVALRPDDTNGYVLYADGNKDLFAEDAKFIDADVYRRGLRLAREQGQPVVSGRLARALADLLWSYGADPQRREAGLTELRALADDVERRRSEDAASAAHVFASLQLSILGWGFEAWPGTPIERRQEALAIARRAAALAPEEPTAAGHLVAALVAVSDDPRGETFDEARREAERFFSLCERADKPDELLATRVAIALCHVLEPRGEDVEAAAVCARALTACPRHPMLPVAVRRALLLCRLDEAPAQLRAALTEAGRRLAVWIDAKSKLGHPVDDAVPLVALLEELAAGTESGALTARDVSARLSTQFRPDAGQQLPLSLPLPPRQR